jgi:chemotaxis protein CheX
MDVKLVNPFIEAFVSVMPQLGFSEVRRGGLGLKEQEIFYSGVLILVGIVGGMKGNVVFSMGMEEAKKIASAMLMGMEVEELDELSTSALSEMANMLAANAATIFSNEGVLIDISTPTLLSGDNISVKMSAKQVLCVSLFADEIPVDINIAFAT